MYLSLHHPFQNPVASYIYVHASSFSSCIITISIFCSLECMISLIYKFPFQKMTGTPAPMLNEHHSFIIFSWFKNSPVGIDAILIRSCTKPVASQKFPVETVSRLNTHNIIAIKKEKS